MDNTLDYQIHKSKTEPPKFEDVYDFEKKVCELCITNPRDLAILHEKFNECVEKQYEESPLIDWPSNIDFHEGASVTMLKWFKHRFEVFNKEGGFLIDIPIRQSAGTRIGTSKGTFKSAINAKIYNADEYDERVKEYNLKRGLMINCLDFDGDLSASDIDRVCEGLKTYESKDVFPEVFFNKVKMEYYGKIEVEETENA